MKANRFSTSEHGVSNVLGGILFFSIVFMFLVVIRTEFVPQWTEDREAMAAITVQGQLAQIKSEADRQAGNRSLGGAGMPLGLGERTASRFFTDATQAGTLSFEPGTSASRLSASEILVFVSEGRSTAAANETWTSITGPVSITDVNDVKHLRLRLHNIGDDDAGDSVTLSIYDVNDNFAGSLMAYIASDPPDKFINVRVTNAGGTVLYDQGTFYHQVTTVPFWWIDALEDEVHFADLLNAAEAPLTLEMTEKDMDGEYTITYVDDTAGGAIVGSSGVTVAGFNSTTASGALTLTRPVQHFVEQTYVLENGGVIVDQGDAAYMRVPPSFQVTVLGTTTRIDLTVPSLIGEGNSLAARGTATVTLDGRGGTQLQGSAPDFQWAVTTAYPDVWADFFGGKLAASGLAASGYTVSTTADSATVAIHGKAVSPTDHDLSIELVRSSIRVTIDI